MSTSKSPWVRLKYLHGGNPRNSKACALPIRGEVPLSHSHHHPILVVEDDPDISNLLVALFESVGFQTISAPDGRFALDLAGQISPSVITLDLGLPILDGHQVLHKLKSNVRTAAIPVIVISASPNLLCQDDRSLVASLVVKPFDADHLVEVVRTTMST